MSLGRQVRNPALNPVLATLSLLQNAIEPIDDAATQPTTHAPTHNCAENPNHRSKHRADWLNIQGDVEHSF